MKVSFTSFGTSVNPEQSQKYKSKNSLSSNIVHPLHQLRPNISVSFQICLSNVVMIFPGNPYQCFTAMKIFFFNLT